MAVVNETSPEYDAQIAIAMPSQSVQVNQGGIRIMSFTHTQVTDADATSTVHLIRLPPGLVTVLFGDSLLETSAFAASSTMHLGWGAHTNMDGTAVAADPDGLLASLDVTGVLLTTNTGAALTAGTGFQKTFDSTGGVDLFITANVSSPALETGDYISGHFKLVTT